MHLYISHPVAGTVGKANENGQHVSNPATGLAGPAGIGFDSAGNLYVACTNDGTIWKIAPNGTKTRFAQGLAQPKGLAVDHAGNVYALGTDGNIQLFNPAGQQSLFATVATNANPYLAFDSAGSLYVSTTRTVVKFTPPSNTPVIVDTVPNFVYGIAFGAQDLRYTSLQNSGAILGLPNNGLIPPDNATTFFPTGLAFDSHNNCLYVAFGDHIRRYNPGGTTAANYPRPNEKIQYLAVGP
ncbi:MAG TPA: hypothetical protein VFC07_02105 [Verrucomicrobiae bacterium]|nr:hypothetical protein [Verrucomicrobiae bacterium]